MTTGDCRIPFLFIAKRDRKALKKIQISFRELLIGIQKITTGRIRNPIFFFFLLLACSTLLYHIFFPVSAQHMTRKLLHQLIEKFHRLSGTGGIRNKISQKQKFLTSGIYHIVYTCPERNLVTVNICNYSNFHPNLFFPFVLSTIPACEKSYFSHCGLSKCFLPYRHQPSLLPRPPVQVPGSLILQHCDHFLLPDIRWQIFSGFHQDKLPHRR